MTEDEYWYIQGNASVEMLQYHLERRHRKFYMLINIGSNRVSETVVVFQHHIAVHLRHITLQLTHNLSESNVTHHYPITRHHYQSLYIILPIYICLLRPTCHVLPRLSSPAAPESPFLTALFLFHPFLTLHSLSLRSLCHHAPTENPHCWERRTKVFDFETYK